MYRPAAFSRGCAPPLHTACSQSIFESTPLAACICVSIDSENTGRLSARSQTREHRQIEGLSLLKCVHVCTCAQTHAHLHMLARTHAHQPVCKHIRPTCVCAHVRAHTCIHTHTESTPCSYTLHLPTAVSRFLKTASLLPPHVNYTCAAALKLNTGC